MAAETGCKGAAASQLYMALGPLHRETAQAGKPREKKWKGGEGLVYFT